MEKRAPPSVEGKRSRDWGPRDLILGRGKRGGKNSFFGWPKDIHKRTLRFLGVEAKISDRSRLPFLRALFFYLQCFSLSFAVAPKHKHSFSKSVIRISHFPFFLRFFFAVCVYVKSGGARLSFSPHFRRGRKKTQKAAAVLAVFFLFHRRMMHIQFFLEIRKSLFFFALHVAKWNTRRRRRYLRPRNISAFFVEAAIASRQNQRMGGGTLSKQYAYKNSLC